MKKFLFKLLIAALRKSANLKPYQLTCSFGQICYLDNIAKLNNHKAETLVFLHGLGADKDGWGPLLKYFKDKYRLIVLDLPGHGESVQGMDLGYSIEQQVAYVRDILGQLDVTSMHLVGNSMGGAIATRLASEMTAQVRSLTLLNSYGVFKTPSFMENYLKTHDHNPIFDIQDRAGYRTMLSHVMAQPPQMPGFVLDVLVSQIQQRQALNYKILADCQLDPDVTCFLPRIQAPTLVIWGAEDKILHVDNADIFAQEIPNCRKIIYDQIGHVPMAECPERAASDMIAFLDQVSDSE